MKLLKDIVHGLDLKAIIGSTDLAINRLCLDSRAVQNGDVFVAMPGSTSNGAHFINDAIAKGACAIVMGSTPDSPKAGITYMVVDDVASSLSVMACNYYDHPSRKLKLVGITGTNGKTTVASMLYKMSCAMGYKTGLISTVKISINGAVYATQHTTPDAITLNKYFHQMVQQGVSYCFMEVSSHGIHQKRIHGLDFCGGVFTNLSHDHLDYHKTLAEYRDVKKSFFDDLKPQAFALTNKDDKNGLFMLQNTKSRSYTYALKTEADYKATILENEFTGLALKICGENVWTKFVGEFNAYNLLCVYACSCLLGFSASEVLRELSVLSGVEGRFQTIVSAKRITAIVDYAHTPDALKNVLETINTIRSKNEQLITVIGCGGDRDKSKRPIMADIATRLSSRVILTSDNPRSEDPQDILEDMEKGISPDFKNKSLNIIDRRQAIKAALQMAGEKDIVLVAGKGHETYQEVKNVRTYFNDFEVVNEFINNL